MEKGMQIVWKNEKGEIEIEVYESNVWYENGGEWKIEREERGWILFSVTEVER